MGGIARPKKKLAFERAWLTFPTVKKDKGGYAK
jgi:hypothetical protein